MGRSCVGRRCTVPRGPNVLMRLRSVHRASRISVRVIPASRSPMDSSAADNTWACAPHMVPTISAGRASCNGADSPCRSRRLAQTSPHDKRATSVVRLVICTHSCFVREFLTFDLVSLLLRVYPERRTESYLILFRSVRVYPGWQ